MLCVVFLMHLDRLRVTNCAFVVQCFSLSFTGFCSGGADVWWMLLGMVWLVNITNGLQDLWFRRVV